MATTPVRLSKRAGRDFAAVGAGDVLPPVDLSLATLAPTGGAAQKLADMLAAVALAGCISLTALDPTLVLDGANAADAAKVGALLANSPATRFRMEPGQKLACQGDAFTLARNGLELRGFTFVNTRTDLVSQHGTLLVNANFVTVDKCTFDRVSDGTHGSLGLADLYVSGGTGHEITRNTFLGQDSRYCVLVTGATNSIVSGNHASGLSFNKPSATDDSIGFIAVFNCTRVGVERNYGGGFSGNAGSRDGSIAAGTSSPLYCRGIVFSNNKSCWKYDNYLWKLDEAFDDTGSPGNVDCDTVGNVAEDMLNWGFKFANSARGGVVRDNVARRCGNAGFVWSGPADTSTPVTAYTADMAVEDNYSEDAGYTGNLGLGNNAQWASVQPTGFLILPQNNSGAPAPTFPQNIKFRRNKSRSTLGTTAYGARNRVVYVNATDVPCSMEDFECSGELVAKIAGF